MTDRVSTSPSWGLGLRRLRAGNSGNMRYRQQPQPGVVGSGSRAPAGMPERVPQVAEKIPVTAPPTFSKVGSAKNAFYCSAQLAIRRLGRSVARYASRTVSSSNSTRGKNRGQLLLSASFEQARRHSPSRLQVVWAYRNRVLTQTSDRIRE